MQLQQRVSEQQTERQTERQTVRVIDGWYEVEERGYKRPTPVLHFHGRTADGDYRHWVVEDYRPYFFVAVDDVDDATAHALDVSAFERLAESSPPQVGNCAEVIYDVRGGRAVIESFPNFWNARKAAELLDVADEAVRGVDGVETVRGWREIYSVTDGVTEE